MFAELKIAEGGLFELKIAEGGLFEIVWSAGGERTLALSDALNRNFTRLFVTLPCRRSDPREAPYIHTHTNKEDRKSTRKNSRHGHLSRMPSTA